MNKPNVHIFGSSLIPWWCRTLSLIWSLMRLRNASVASKSWIFFRLPSAWLAVASSTAWRKIRTIFRKMSDSWIFKRWSSARQFSRTPMSICWKNRSNGCRIILESSNCFGSMVRTVSAISSTTSKISSDVALPLLCTRSNRISNSLNSVNRSFPADASPSSLFWTAFGW